MELCYKQDVKFYLNQKLQKSKLTVTESEKITSKMNEIRILHISDGTDWQLNGSLTRSCYY